MTLTNYRWYSIHDYKWIYLIWTRVVCRRRDGSLRVWCAWCMLFGACSPSSSCSTVRIVHACGLVLGLGCLPSLARLRPLLASRGAGGREERHQGCIRSLPSINNARSRFRLRSERNREAPFSHRHRSRLQTFPRAISRMN